MISSGRSSSGGNASAPRKWRRLLVGLSVSALTSFALLVGAEVGCRIAGYGKGPAMYYDPNIGSRFHPNQTRTVDVRKGRGLLELVFNGLGFRGPMPKDPPGEPRIACIGDSFTFGWGVQGDDAYPPVLQELLRTQPGFGNSEVLNFGIPGFNTWNELQLYRRVVQPFAPDIVVIGFYANDVKPDGGASALDEVLVLRWLTRFTPALAEGLRRHFFSKMEVGKPRVGEQDRRRLAQWRKHQKEIIDDPRRGAWRPMWNDCMGELTALLEEARAGGARALVVYFPTPEQTRAYDDAAAQGSGPSTELERLVEEHAAKAGATFLSLLPDFGSSEANPFGEIHHTHPGVHGYRLSAERIAAALADLR